MAVAAAWTVTLVAMKPESELEGWLLLIGLLVPSALALMARQRLYLARVCSIRSVETVGLLRASLLVALLAFLVSGRMPAMVTVGDAAVGAAAMFLLLRGGRSAFAGYLYAGRRAGRFARRLLLVGGNEEAVDLYRLLGHHPELGYQIVGFVSDDGAADPSMAAPWLGTVADVSEAVAGSEATGVIVAVTALDTDCLNRLIRTLTERSVHVHLSGGIQGIAQSGCGRSRSPASRCSTLSRGTSGRGSKQPSEPSTSWWRP